MSSTQWGERKAGASKDEVESGRWIAVQKRIFTRWANAYLRMRKMKITDLCTDLQDGVLLINLLEVLSHESVGKYRKHPKMEIHKRENLKAAFEFMASKNLPLTNVGSSDVFAGTEKIILGLFWTIISKFQVGEISVDGVSGKDGLMLWCQRNTQGYEGVHIKNFHRSWKDGLAFCALLHKHRPDIIDYDSLSADNPAENLALAFQLAEDFFGIDRILDVEDLVEVPKPDEKIVVTAVAFCFKGYVDYLRRCGFAKSIGKAIDITLRHDQWIAEYTEKSTALRDFCENTREYYGSRDHGNTAAAVKEALDAFNSYKSETKPEWKAQLTQLEGVFNTFTTSCRNNNRPVYVPEAGKDISTLQSMWAALGEAENAYETSVRERFSQFVTVEHNLAKFAVKEAKFTSWMDAKLETFQAGDYGNNLVEAETLVAAHASYESQLTNMQALLETCRGWAACPGIEAHAQHEATQAALSAMEEKLEQTVAAGTQHGANLESVREQYEAFEALDKVATWAVAQQEFFSTGIYGETLLETNGLIEEHSQWSVQLAAKRELVDGMSSEQDVIVERITAEKGNLDAIAEHAATYAAYLEMQKELYEKYDAMDKVLGWCETQNATFQTEEYGEDLAAVRNLLEEFKDTFTVNVPTQKAVLEEMTSEQEAITTRRDEVLAHMQATEEAAEYYRIQLLLSQERFEKLPALDRCEAWMADQNATFQAADYGASLSEVASLLEAYGTFQSNAAAQQEVLSTMESNQEVILNRLAELQAKMQETSAAAEEYQTQLLLSQERLEKMPAIDQVVAWLEAQHAVFTSANRGDSLADVLDLIAVHETFEANHAKQQAVIDGMETHQEVIQSALDAATAKLVACAKNGQAYHQQLLLSKERHEKIPLIERIEAWFDKQHTLFTTLEIGDTIAEVANLLADYDSIAAALQARKEALEAITSEQDVIMKRRQGVLSKAEALQAAGAEYHSQLMLGQERLTKFAVLDRVESWLAERAAFFAGGDYGSTLVEVSTLLASFETFGPTMASKLASVSSMASEQAVITDRRDATLARGMEVEAAAEEYRTQVLLSQERLEKLPMLERVDAWVATQQELFGKQEYGSTLVEVATLLFSFGESFVGGAPSKKALLESMESEQEVITTKLAETRAAMAACEEAADYYNTELLLSQERLTKLPLLERVAAWLATQDAVFAAGEYGDTLVAVATLMTAYDSFTVNLAAKNSAVAELETYQDVIQAKIDEVKASLAATQEAGSAYQAQLLLSRERLQKLPALDRVDTWLATQNELFSAGVYGDSQQACTALLDAFKETYGRQMASHKEAVEAMATEQEVIQTRIDAVKANLAATDEAAETYRASCQANLDYYQRLKDLTKEFNKSADDFVYALDDIADDLAEPIDGTSIDQLTALVERFQGVVKPQVDTLTEKYNQIDAVCTELTEAGWEQAFNRYTLTDLYNKYIAVYSQMADREAALQASLEAEQANDALRQDFASAAEAVVTYCDSTSAQVGALEGSLEEQAAALQALRNAHASSTLLATADEKAAALHEAGIVDNRHTGETSFSLHAQWDALGEVFERADESLQGQLLAARDESITPEQYREIKEVFEFFDVGKDNYLSQEEFHNCCTGIGLILTTEEVKARVAELDTTGDGLVNFEEFTKFMMERLVEPGHTREDVKGSFVDLADNEPAVSRKTLVRTFANESHLAYLTEHMAPTRIPSVDGEEDAFQYDEFVDQLFTR